VSVAAPWLLYRPRAFARGRDYGVVTREAAVPARVSDEFIAVAERSLALHGGSEAEVWQYTPIAAADSAILSRCSLAERGGAHSPVVWGLLLPQELLHGIELPLLACARQFPAGTGDEGTFPVHLLVNGSSSAEPPDPLSMRLFAHYVETGKLRVSLEHERALALFCQIVEWLPPRDRLEVSFSTAEAGLCSLEVQEASPPPSDISFSHDGLARIYLWRTLKGRAEAGQWASAASVRRRAEAWLGDAPGPAALKSRYAALVTAMHECPDARVRSAGLRYVRIGLQNHIRRLGAPVAGALLDSLSHAGLLGPEYDVPPAWLAGVVFRKNCLHRVTRETKHRVLRGDVLQLLTKGISPEVESSEPPLGRLDNFVRALDDLGPGKETRPLLEACRSAREELLVQGITERSLARAIAVAIVESRLGGSPTS
jgi:hypothetical protein